MQDGTYGTLKKQMAGMGCVHIGDSTQSALLQLDGLGAGLQQHSEQRPGFRVWLYSSDAGPDQKSMRNNNMRADLGPGEALVDCDCLMHQAQLATKSSLTLIDLYLAGSFKKGWKYFATVSKLSHLWRAEARRVFTTWVTCLGTVSAVKHARTLPPKPIPGRWGTITRSEQGLFGAGVQSLAVLEQAVLRDGGESAPLLSLTDGAESKHVGIGL